MRAFSICDDLEVVILELVRAIPEVFLDYNTGSVEIVEVYPLCEGVVAAWDIVFVESDDYEVVIGDVVLNKSLIAVIDIYSDEE